MTSHKHLKQRIRARMAETGERYATARLHVLAAVATGAPAPGELEAGGYELRGGIHPETAGIASVLADRGVTDPRTGEPLTEAMILGVGGGLGAGYILWEFEAHGRPDVVLGFRNQWQYPDRWARGACERLGLDFELRETGGRRQAEAWLRESLEAGVAALAWVDMQLMGYRHLPPELRGYHGQPVVVYAIDDERGVALVDDRTRAPLTVALGALADARAQIPSYKQRLLLLDPVAGPIGVDRLRDAVGAGLRDCAAHLSGRSSSFQLPAWRKWARLMTDTRNAKAWPRVFADRTGLFGACLSIHRAVGRGRSLRGLYADFLDEAAALTGRASLGPVAAAYRELEKGWCELGELAAPAGVAPFDEARRLGAERDRALAEGDAGQEAMAAAAGRSWALRREWSADFPLGDDEVAGLFERLHDQLGLLYRGEVEAATALARALEN